VIRPSLAALLITGCVRVPDQSHVLRVSDLARLGMPFVRVYGAPIPALRHVAIHTWLVTKSSADAPVERWEVWATGQGPYAHVRRDLMAPEAHVGAGHAFLIAEKIGPQAVPIAAFIEKNAPIYPCKDFYLLIPGPNSNGFVKWMLSSVGWHVDLGPGAIGKPCDEPPAQ
jgi:hypothetical protein